MRLVIVQDFLRSGGTERQTVLNANAFAGAGDDVALVTFRPGGKIADTVSRKVRRIALQPFDLGLDWFSPGLVRVVKKQTPDIVLCMGRMANCAAGKLQRALPDAAVIATMRTGKKLPALFRKSLLAVRHVVANSNDAARVLREEHAVPAEKISVIYNALVHAPDPHANARGERAIFRARQHVADDTAVLLCTAMFRPEKNQRELIEIVAQLPAQADWQLWLAGDGAALPACRALVAEKNLTARVKFFGMLSDPRPLCLAADIAVLTSRSESLSNFLCEAHAHGLPSVAYDIVGVRECGGEVVGAGDQKTFSEKLLALIADKKAREFAGNAAARYAKENFSRTAQFEKYRALFEKLARKN